MNPQPLQLLIDAWREDTLSPKQAAELNAVLRESEEARREFREEARLHGLLHCAAAGAVVTEASGNILRGTMKVKKTRWVAWRPLTAAAAGIVLGMLGTSMVLAYVAPSLGKAITLLQENFESGPAQVGGGVPIQAGVWSGDFSEIVGEQQGVKPTSGKKMLRFLRGDYEGRNIPSSHSSDVFRLVDIRPFTSGFADGGAVVQLSAVFNAVPFSMDEKFTATLTLFALDAGMAGNEMMKAENVLSTESLAFSRSSKVVMDRDPATWQKVSNELRLPPDTEFLMVRMGMSNDTKSPDRRRDSFGGHFADKVQLVLARRSEIPIP